MEKEKSTKDRPRLTIYEKLGKIQRQLKAPKNNYNKFGGYKYRSLESIFEAVKPLLELYQCQLVMQDEIVLIGSRYYVKATAILLSEGEQIQTSAFAREAEARKGNDESQITGASSSYARKYALNGLFAIDDTKDADTEEAHKMREGNTQEQVSQETTGDETKLCSSEEIAMLIDLFMIPTENGELVVDEARLQKALQWVGCADINKITIGQRHKIANIILKEKGKNK